MTPAQTWRKSTPRHGAWSSTMGVHMFLLCLVWEGATEHSVLCGADMHLSQQWICFLWDLRHLVIKGEKYVSDQRNPHKRSGLIRSHGNITVPHWPSVYLILETWSAGEGVSIFFEYSQHGSKDGKSAAYFHSCMWMNSTMRLSFVIQSLHLLNRLI